MSDQAIKVSQGVLAEQDVQDGPILPMWLCVVQMNQEVCIRSCFFTRTKAEQAFGTEHGAGETLLPETGYHLVKVRSKGPFRCSLKNL